MPMLKLMMAAALLAGAWAPVVLASAEERFTLLHDGAVVRDNRTGLLWEREPDREHEVWRRSLERCATKSVGGQTGWRPPTIQEIGTLVDTEQQDPSLPAGHPFVGIRSEIFWTSTPDPTFDMVAWQQSFLTGQAVTDQRSGMRRLWCVLAP